MNKHKFLTDQPQKPYKLSQLLENNTTDLDDLSDVIPGIVHINSRKDFTFIFMSKAGCDILGYSNEEFRELGLNILEKHQSDYTLKVAYPRLLNEINRNDKNHVVTFFQDWRVKKNDAPFIFFSNSKILNESLLLTVSLLPDKIEHFSNMTNSSFGANNIYYNYFRIFSKLTHREKEILFLLSEQLNRKAISYKLYISEHTVKKHCENIYRKLKTHNRREIEKIALAFYNN